MVIMLTCTLCIAGPQNPGLGRKSHGYSFWDAIDVIRKDIFETRTLHRNIQNSDSAIKKSSEAQEEHFARI